MLVFVCAPVWFRVPMMQTTARLEPGNKCQIEEVSENGSDGAAIKLYKTRLCVNWAIRGSCHYGDVCTFAHGVTDLRRRKKVSLEPCKTYSRLGCCPYGEMCGYLHIRRLPVFRCLAY